MNLTDPIFTDKTIAREYLEHTRWADGVYCPHCGGVDRIKKMEGKSHRPGLLQCGDCRKQFTVTVGTIFERSKVPLNKWLLATFLMASSKKGISAHQLHRSIGVTYKTAWFMFHRIREAMRSDDGPFGVGGGHVEIDETYIGKEPGVKKSKTARGGAHKMKIMTLFNRNRGMAKSVVIDDLRVSTMTKVVSENMAREAKMLTDEASQYKLMADKVAAGHDTVNHSAGEYGRGEIHTNTVEGFYSIFKRGMKGVYQHRGKQHLHRYAAEFDFRYNHRAAKEIDDTMRANAILRGAEGKRLTYRRTNSVVA
ncbi:IS1595 family transposase [Jannaschia formosa]|uniref:IS1595 family transposase n=1 Tax=Jannaschia formosa TaxID=2259592 RepID=UPI000E1C33E4|nr:IS1595 family transposase [Jannaschia formosa]TFL16118.1 IS1595 family transposase [Jannaschia formosa]